MIIEFFSINNEWDLLQLHLQEHSAHVDRFVITESNRTYQQKEKPYLWDVKKHLYEEWHDKIQYVRFDAEGLPPGWQTEQAQRAFAFGNVEYDKDDLLIISDVDEMLRGKDWHVCRKIREVKEREILFDTECYYCYVNLRLKKKQQAIAVTTGSKFVDPTLHRRPHLVDQAMPQTLKCNGGIHFTWMGDRKTFEEKMFANIESFDYSRYATIERLWQDKKNGRLFSDKKKLKLTKLEKVDIESNPSFSPSIKEFVRLRPDWVLSPGHNQ